MLNIAKKKILTIPLWTKKSSLQPGPFLKTILKAVWIYTGVYKSLTLSENFNTAVKTIFRRCLLHKGVMMQKVMADAVPVTAKKQQNILQLNRFLF